MSLTSRADTLYHRVLLRVRVDIDQQTQPLRLAQLRITTANKRIEHASPQDRAVISASIDIGPDPCLQIPPPDNRRRDPIKLNLCMSAVDNLTPVWRFFQMDAYRHCPRSAAPN